MFSFVISNIYLCLIPLFLASIIANLIDSNDKISDGNLELPQAATLCCEL
jgi:hypothetical protein